MNRLLLTIFTIFWLSGFAQELSGVLPKYESCVYSDTVPLYWNGNEDAIDYTVELSPVSDFSSGVISSGLITVTNWTTPSLIFGTWYWRVTANTPAGTVTGEIEKFTYWDPSQAQALSFWVHADAGLTLDGINGVISWQDQSSNAHLLTQDSIAERPILNSSSLNGLPSLQFNGGQFLDGGDILDFNNNSRTIYAIAELSQPSGDCLLAKGMASNVNTRYTLLRGGNGLMYFFYQDVNQASITSSTVPYSVSLFKGYSDRTLAQNKFIVNHDTIGSAGISSFYNMNSDFRFLVGAYNELGDTSERFHLDGYISEIIFVDQVEDSTDFRFNNYLRDKYSTPLDLGTDAYVQDRFCDTNITATAGYTNILWSTGATTNTISVNEGVYWVEGTDLFGFVHRDTIEVHYPAIPGSPTTGICAGSSVVWNADLGPGFTYLWSTGETTPSISITAPGNYSVEVFDSYGCSRMSSTESFTIDNYATTATLGNDTSLCVSNELYLQIGAPETVSYLWPDASTGTLYGVDTTGMYWVEATNVNGCVAQDTVNITILGNAPNAFFDTPDDCLGQTTLFTDASTPQGGDPLVSWDWDFGDSNTDNVSNTSNQYASNGMYVVTLDIVAQSGCGPFKTLV